MGFHNRLFRLVSWVREATSYTSPILNTIYDPSSDIEAGQRPAGNNHLPTDSEEHDPMGMEDENEFEFIIQTKVTNFLFNKGVILILITSPNNTSWLNQFICVVLCCVVSCVCCTVKQRRACNSFFHSFSL
ncbi:hypothetical protein QVD17_33728 [Tagetes erecta]|uniref:Uncharacterized protein n=1 Tax=Tagetes erecta TaxID=13708 RepID=A0AAD8NLF5_TARER|nr:hypothetical protein QVD17_33728 [Tagetes erecta]